MEKQVRELIAAHILYAYGCAAKFFRWAAAVGIDRDDVKAEARLALTEAATRWFKVGEGENFKPYLAKTINNRVRAFLHNNSQSVGLGRNRHLRGMIWKVAADMAKEINRMTPEEIAMAAKLLGTSEGVLRAVWERCVAGEVSLDSHVGDPDGQKWGEILTLPQEEVDGRAFYMTPEQILIAKEEAKANNRFRKSPEVERKLLHSWLEFLPKTYSQVLRHRYLYHVRQQSRSAYAFRSLCSKRHGGTASDAGLGMTPAQAEAIEAEALAMLRRFARGDFAGADFTHVVRRVPKPLVERFMQDLDDGCAKMAMEYRLLKSYSALTRSRGREYMSHDMRGSLKVVARVWRKRLSAQMGRELSKQEAEAEVRQRFAKACKALAIQVGIAPRWEEKSEAATGEEELTVAAA